MDCDLCTLPAESNTLKCNGTCGNLFHVSCLASKNDTYKNALCGYLSKIPNLRWFCDSCASHIYVTTELTKQLTDIKCFADNFLTMLTPSNSTTQTIVNTVPALSNEQFNRDASNLNGSFFTAISENEPMDHQSSSPTIQELPLGLNEGASTSSLASMVTTRKRHLPASPGVSSRQNKHVKLDDKQPVALANLIADPKIKNMPEPNIVVKTNMTRSIYISPFRPETEPSHIMNHLQLIGDLKHIVPNIVCTKLTRPKQRVHFVSFKLEVPRHHYDILVNPAIWKFEGKDEVTISEFNENSAARDKAAANDRNPFSGPPRLNNIAKNHRSSSMLNRNRQHSAQSSQCMGMHQQQRPNFKRPSKIANKNSPNRQQFISAPHHTCMHQQQCQNFQHRCQKQCCNQPRPQCFNCPDRCAENRFGHRPTNHH